MSQEVKYIKLADLVLWTENPRDPIDDEASDQDVVNKAFEDKLSKWTLSSLAREMGDYYDLSELPTVVYHNGRPIVYDGNRRIVLGKLKLGLVKIPTKTNIRIPDFPNDIPCNVCSQDIALKNVYRKHSGTGSWLPLERDIFLHKFMKEAKSPFLILDEATGIITANPYLNQGFVRDEIFKEENLKSLGFTIKNDALHSRHTEGEALSILTDLSNKIEDKTITTRKNRGKVLEVLSTPSQQLINNNKNRELRPINNLKINSGSTQGAKQKQSRRTPKKDSEIFGGKLYLRIGEVSNLYRDIMDLHRFYTDNKNTLSQSFPSLIRMSLRLLCETAAKDQRISLDSYVKNNFDNAKSMLSQ